MKIFMRILLVSAVLTGAVQFRVYREDDKVKVDAEIGKVDEVIGNAGKMINAAGNALGQIAESAQVQQQSPVQTQAQIPVQTTVQAQPVPEAAPSAYYYVRESYENLLSQKGTYYDLASAVGMCPAGFCVFDANGQLVYRAA